MLEPLALNLGVDADLSRRPISGETAHVRATGYWKDTPELIQVGSRGADADSEALRDLLLCPAIPQKLEHLVKTPV